MGYVNSPGAGVQRNRFERVRQGVVEGGAVRWPSPVTVGADGES
jgi:hypothetical protein